MPSRRALSPPFTPVLPNNVPPIRDLHLATRRRFGAPPALSSEEDESRSGGPGFGMGVVSRIPEVRRKVARMLKLTVHNRAMAATLVLEGRLRGPWVNEVEREWSRLASEKGSNNLVADLSGVTFIDAEGRNLLERMMKEGTELRASDLLSRFVIDEIKLALQRKKGIVGHART